MEKTAKKTITIIGGGASSLLLAALLDNKKYEIFICEKNKALGRKFLVAGDGGFNLTHSENIPDFISRYSPASFITPYLTEFTNEDFRIYLKSIGIETYVGSSKRVFPLKNIKPIEVLNAFEQQLLNNNVKLHFQQNWKGFTASNELLVEHNNEIKTLSADIIVFSLGGASWKITGSSGDWLPYFKEKNIKVVDWEASNCAYKIEHKNYTKNIFGEALKNCVFTCGNKIKKGEAVITQFGIEGSAVYPLGQEIRNQLNEKGKALLFVDFKPDLNMEEIKKRIFEKGDYSIKDTLAKKIKLSNLQIELLKQNSTKEEYNDAHKLALLIKRFCFEIIGTAPIDEAISSVGGIDLSEIDLNFELKKLPKHYCIGEMLNWDAPTGGYLLQACFSMAYHLAKHLNSKK